MGLPTMPNSNCTGEIGMTALLTAGGADSLRRPETRKGLNSGLTQQARWVKTGKNVVPLSPKPQVAGSIPVPPAPSEAEFMGVAAA
jgi:hypothetical protein